MYPLMKKFRNPVSCHTLFCDLGENQVKIEATVPLFVIKIKMDANKTFNQNDKRSRVAFRLKKRTMSQKSNNNSLKTDKYMTAIPT